MTVQLLVGDVFERVRGIPDESVDLCATSPPYWGLRSYLADDHPDKPLEMGLEPTLGEHLDRLILLFREVRRVLKPSGVCFVNYGDCYATKPNGRSAAATKAGGNDDRAFRDKPFSTVGPLYGKGDFPKGAHFDASVRRGGGVLKPKDLCLIPARLAIALQEDGWYVRSRIVWGKGNPMPDTRGRDRPSVAHEEILFIAKSERHFYNAAAVALPTSGTAHPRRSYKQPDGWDTTRGEGGHGVNHKAGRGTGKRSETPGLDRGKRAFMHDQATDFTDTRFLRNYEAAPPEVWHINGRPFREAHFATFPPELVDRCIKAGCPEGGVVLDPFGGAGTTGLVAEALGRDSILIELSADYAKIAKRRIVAAHGDCVLMDGVKRGRRGRAA